MNAQDAIPWFDIYNPEINSDAFQSRSGDCIIVKDGYDESLKTNVKELESKQWFMHTLPEFKKWMGRVCYFAAFFKRVN